MSILRSENWLGQQRCDVPHLRSIESASNGDWDMWAGRSVAGQAPYVLRGFGVNGTNGSAANSLSITTADGILVNLNASESGSILWIPTNRPLEVLNSTNANLSGNFTPSATNTIGMDFVRSADPTTSDTVQFLDPNTDSESPKIVPLARTLNYKIVISTQPFASQPNIIPIAQIVTDSSNNVVSITDCRPMLLGLSTGGDNPNLTASYGWPFGRTPNSLNTFVGGDKQFGSLVELSNAQTTRLWELGGGERWFSPTADRNVTFIGNGSPMADSDYFTWDGTNLTWQNLTFVFDNSTGHINDVADQTSSSPGLTDLADGQCIYVDLDRTQQRTRTGANALVAHKATMTTLGTPIIPGSRYILAWRVGSNVFGRGNRYPVGQAFTIATPTAYGLVKVTELPTNDTTSIVPTTNYFKFSMAINNASNSQAFTAPTSPLLWGSSEFGANMFVASDGTNLYTGSHPASLTSRSLSHTPTGNPCFASNGTNMSVFGAFKVSSNLCLFSSPDNVTWTQATGIVAVNIAALAWAGSLGTPLFVGLDTGGGQLYSANGTTWSGGGSVTMPSSLGIATGGGVVVYYNKTNTTYGYSTNGTSIASHTLPVVPANFQATDGAALMSIIFSAVGGTAQFILYGNDGSIWTSPDGLTWTNTTTTQPTGLTVALVGSDMYYGVLGGSGYSFATAPDGVNWTVRLMVNPNPVTLEGAVASVVNGMFIVGGSGGNILTPPLTYP